jgi:glutamine synthetase
MSTASVTAKLTKQYEIMFEGDLGGGTQKFAESDLGLFAKAGLVTVDPADGELRDRITALIHEQTDLVEVDAEDLAANIINALSESTA